MPGLTKKNGKKADTSTVTASTRKSEPNIPPWPLLERPYEEISLHQLLPGQIVTIPGFWDSFFCKRFVEFLRGLPLTTTPGKPKKGEAVRVNDRFQIDDGSFAARLWNETGLKELVLAANLDDAPVGSEEDVSRRQNNIWGGTPIGLSPNIRVYRYSAGQYFDQHCLLSIGRDRNFLLITNARHDDAPKVIALGLTSLTPDDDSNLVTLEGPPAVPAKTTWTLLLYLSSPAEGCNGGETVFYPDPPPTKKGKREQTAPIVVGLETGMLLLHRHGKDCLLHEGKEVTAGEKWVLRTDLCVKR